MERNEFLKTIKACRRRLNMGKFLRGLLFAVCVGMGVGILFQIVAFLVPFYYVNWYTAAAVLLAIGTAVVVAFLKRSTMKQSALVMDSFGFQERIITAYEHLEEDGTMVRLQREDAMRQLEKRKSEIKIIVWPTWKKWLGVVSCFLILLGLMITPSPMKEQAKELHLVKEEAEEKQEEVEEVLEGLEELGQEALTPEQLAALQEMMEALQASMAEYEQVASAEMLATANEKLEYKYGNMGSQLADMAAALENGAMTSAVSREAMQAMAQQLQQMSGTQSLASNQGQNGQNGQPGNGQNGQGSNSSGSNQNGQNSNSGQNGQGNGQGNQSGSGNGQGGQNGSGGGQGGQNGSGNGQGSGNSSGSGSGSGNGRGEGHSDALHDYVSIPNALIDSGNLTGNAGNHDNSEFFRTQNGLSWEGTHVSHETVIGQYEQNAYEGISAGRYPSGMEDVIKEYFASFN